jgi:TolB-like protein/Flp pilus assembly protein TadD
MPTEQPTVQLEIAHVLFIDIVGYSKLLTNEQRQRVEQLSEVVRSTDQFRSANDAGKLVRLTTGDGMALAFFTSPDAPARCAVQIAGRLRNRSDLPLRMGIHSGPVSGLTDVNDRSNIAGAGINMAQRIMDCGDAGHILLSKRIADDLEQYPEWRETLHDLGPIEVKHGLKIDLVNLYNDEVGRAELPDKFKQAAKANRSAVTRRRRRIAIAAAVVVAITSVVGFWISRSSKPISYAPTSDKSIAVLPLENLSEAKENAYFADGIQDELLSNLAKIRDLKVISRTSVMQYKAGITRSLKEIAKQLGVSNVVEGSVRRSGDHVRVSVQLIDARADRHIWAQNYDRNMADSLALQGELATEIAAAIGATLSPQEKARVEATPTKNTAAYQAYLRGRALMTSSSYNNSNPIEAPHAFEEAVTWDSGFALAWVYLACADCLIYWTGFDSTPARLASAKTAVDRAVALDPNLPETHLALGYYLFYGRRDFNGALGEFEVAEKGLPNNIDVLQAIGLIQRRIGQWDQAIAVLRRLVELDPRNTHSASILAMTYMAVRHFNDALAVSDHMLTVEPSNAMAIFTKTYCLWALGNPKAADVVLSDPGAVVHLRAHAALNKRHYAEAVDLFSQALNQKPEGDEKNELMLDLGLAQQRAGNAAGSKAAYQQAVQQLTHDLSTVTKDSAPEAALHSFLGVAYAGLGNADAAVSEGQKGIALQPTSQDPFEGPNREEQMAQIYALLGNADEAMPILKRLLHTPGITEIVPALMRMDPIWDPIRCDPRFVELLAEAAKPLK